MIDDETLKKVLMDEVAKGPLKGRNATLNCNSPGGCKSKGPPGYFIPVALTPIERKLLTRWLRVRTRLASLLVKVAEQLLGNDSEDHYDE